MNITVILIIIAAVVIVFATKFTNKKTKELWDIQIKKRNGKAAGTGMAFDYKGNQIGVVYAPVSGIRDRVFFTVQIPVNTEKDITLRLFKKNIRNMVARKSVGTKSVIIGNDAFDKNFIIESENEDFVYNFMSPDIQLKFQEMLRLSPNLEIRKSAFFYIYQYQLPPPLPTIINISVLENEPANQEEFDQVVELSLSLLDRFKDLIA